MFGDLVLFPGDFAELLASVDVDPALRHSQVSLPKEVRLKYGFTSCLCRSFLLGFPFSIL
jgi:hypothetical protein